MKILVHIELKLQKEQGCFRVGFVVKDAHQTASQHAVRSVRDPAHRSAEGNHVCVTFQPGRGLSWGDLQGASGPHREWSS